MPVSCRRNSMVLYGGGLSPNRDAWRRSFRQQKRSSIAEMEPIAHEEEAVAATVVPTATLGENLLPDLDEFGQPFVYSNMRVRIRGKYEFVDSRANCVGHGAYGDVFKGKTLDSATTSVAVKRMTEMNVKSNELDAMKKVQDPFLVCLIDICHEADDANVYVIMELCDTDLDQFLRTQRRGALDSNEYDLVMRDLARGYYALYMENIVHRDIKPQNVLLILDGQNIGRAKLTDFGVCRMLENEEGGLCNVAGTFYYMAPEVGANVLTTCEYGHSVDMWSIGCVLYQCQVGELPFDEASLCRLFLCCAGHNYEAYETPKLPSQIPKEHSDLIGHLLEIDPEKRLTPKELYTIAVAKALSAST